MFADEETLREHIGNTVVHQSNGRGIVIVAGTLIPLESLIQINEWYDISLMTFHRTGFCP